MCAGSDAVEILFCAGVCVHIPLCAGQGSVVGISLLFFVCFPPFQPMEVYVDDEAKLTLHGLQQHYVKLQDKEKNRKLFELLDVLEFNQVCCPYCVNTFGAYTVLNSFYGDYLFTDKECLR